MKPIFSIDPGISDLVPGFEAESELERRITSDPALLRCLAWNCGSSRSCTNGLERVRYTADRRVLDAIEHRGGPGVAALLARLGT